MGIPELCVGRNIHHTCMYCGLHRRTGEFCGSFFVPGVETGDFVVQFSRLGVPLNRMCGVLSLEWGEMDCGDVENIGE